MKEIRRDSRHAWLYDTRTVIENTFTNIINGEPDALNVLKVVSDALGANAKFSTSILHKINSKSEEFTVSSPLHLDFNPTIPELFNAIAAVCCNTESDSVLHAKAAATTVYTETE